MYSADLLICHFENVAFSLLLTLEIPYSEKLCPRPMWPHVVFCWLSRTTNAKPAKRVRSGLQFSVTNSFQLAEAELALAGGTRNSLAASGLEASLLAENMKIGMVVYFGMLFHILRGGACSDHLVAAKCSILDEILLQIAISQKVFDGFWWNLIWNIPFGRRILLPNSKLLQQPEGLLQLAANF